MKKIVFLFVFIIAGTLLGSSQGKDSKAKDEAKDSITVQDLAKIRYVVSVIVNTYNQECYNDSIPVKDFYNKPIGGAWWREKGQYYWDIYTPLPNNVRYLHRRMTAEGLLEKFSTSLGG